MQQFQTLIDSMPVKYQSFSTKVSTWHKYRDSGGELAQIFNGLFCGKESLDLSRGDLFTIAKEAGLKKLLIAVILWGYPRGMRGNHFDNIVKNIDPIAELLSEAKQGVDDWNSHSSKLNAFSGLGLSTYSKFLYFLNVDVNGSKALILDDRIIKTVRKGTFQELSPISNIRMHNAISNYPKYLKTIDDIGTTLNVSRENIEMFLFEFGLNLKR